MIAILSALLGFFSSFVPEIFNFLKDKKDKEHELKLIDRQVEALKNGHSSRLEEIQIMADSQESKYLYQYAGYQIAGIGSINGSASGNGSNSHWINILSASVRPTITYTFFLLYALIKITSFIKYGLASNVWNVEDQGIFCAVIGFWFGHRAFGKVKLGSGYNSLSGNNSSNGSNNVNAASISSNGSGITNAFVNGNSSSHDNSRIYSDTSHYNYGNGSGYGLTDQGKTTSKDKEYPNVKQYVNGKDQGKIKAGNIKVKDKDSGKDTSKFGSKQRNNNGVTGYFDDY